MSGVEIYYTESKWRILIDGQDVTDHLSGFRIESVHPATVTLTAKTGSDVSVLLEDTEIRTEPDEHEWIDVSSLEDRARGEKKTVCTGCDHMKTVPISHQSKIDFTERRPGVPVHIDPRYATNWPGRRADG